MHIVGINKYTFFEIWGFLEMDYVKPKATFIFRKEHFTKEKEMDFKLYKKTPNTFSNKRIFQRH